MPYDPKVTNHGGEYIMRGAEIAAQGISDGLKAMNERHQESDYLDGAGQYYFKDDPEQYAKFREASVGGKRGMITGQQAQQARDLQQQQTNMQNWSAEDQSARGWYGLTQKEEPWSPSADQLKSAADNNYLWLPQTPHSGTFVPMKGSKGGTPPLGSDPTGTGQFYFDGGRLKPVPTTALPSDVRTGIETTQSQIDAINKQISAKQDELANGNQRSGPDWLGGLLGKSYAEEIKDLTTRRAELSKKMDTLKYTGGRLPLTPSGLPPAPRPSTTGPATPNAAAPALPGAAAPVTDAPAPPNLHIDANGNQAIKNPDGTFTPLRRATPPQGAVDPGTVDYVKQFEGFNAKAYPDGSQTSVGYGTRARSADETLSEPEATKRLTQELATHRQRIVDAAQAHQVQLAPHQLQALTSYDYNTGLGPQAIAQSGGDLTKVGSAIAAGPVTQGGKRLDGLVKRRAAEARLFTMGSY